MSKAIKALESEVGMPLFVADGRRVRLSDAGVLLAAEAERLIDHLDRVKNSIHGEASHQRLRLGGFEVFTTYILGELCSQEFADLDIEVHELVPGRLEEAIVSRQVDIGITYLPIPHAELEFLKVTSIEMGVFGARRFQDTPWNKLPFVVPTTPVTQTPTKVHGLDGWPEDRFARKVRYRATLMESALELCRRGLAVAYLPCFIARLHNVQAKPAFQLEPIDMPRIPLDTRNQDVWIVQRKAGEEQAVARKIARRLRMTCKTL